MIPMLEDIFVSIFSSLVTAGILETAGIIKNRRRHFKIKNNEEPETQRVAPGPAWALGILLPRIFKSLLSGFIFAGILAGILETEGYPDIAIGSSPMLILLVICTALSWLAFFRKEESEAVK